MALLDIIGGMAGAVGKFSTETAAAYIQKNIVDERDARLNEMAGARESAGRREAFEYNQRGADAQVDRDVRREGLLTPGLLARAQGMSDIGTAAERRRAQDRLDVEYSPENIQKKIDALKTLAPVEAQVKADAEIAALLKKAQTPGVLDAMRAFARAAQVLTPGQVAEGRIKEMELDRAKLVDKFQTRYAAAVEAGNRKEATEIINVMTARFFDPAKMKETDAAALKSAQAILTDISSPEEAKDRARNYIMSVLSASATKRGEAANEPHPDGSIVTREGKKYIVQNGRPVLMSEAERRAGEADRPRAAQTPPVVEPQSEASSPAGRLQARIRGAATGRATAEAESKQADKATQAQFDADLKKMSGEDLAFTYDDLLWRLTPSQVTQYRNRIKER